MPGLKRSACSAQHSESVSRSGQFSWGCWLNHGKVFPRYISALIDAAELSSLIERRMEFFRSKVIEEDSPHLAREMATPFGLLYAAGRLARDSSLVPWPPKKIRKAITACYRAAASQIPNEQAAQIIGAKKMQVALSKLPSKDNWSKTNPRAQGYSDNGTFVIERKYFDALFESASECELVMSWLKQRRRIQIAKSKTGTANPKLQTVWPDGSRRRSLTIVGIE